MNKKTELWSLEKLSEQFLRIEFPEYQREPNLWARIEKQRLIDSVVRDFDIASLYLYITEAGTIECIDGRQRIGALMSFFGENDEDADNEFEYRRLNEVYVDESSEFTAAEDRTWDDIRSSLEGGEEELQPFVDAIEAYRVTVVVLSGSKRPDEFNLQFTRLNLGTILNSGEKLHAMVGDLRNVCFDDEEGLGQHPFLANTRIPTRRYSREQVAAQILGQVFALTDPVEANFGRTRHFDLQRLFKAHTELDERGKELVSDVKRTMDALAAGFGDVGILRNRALTVSTVILAWGLGIRDRAAAEVLGEFLADFLCRLQWQVGRGLDVDFEYRPLIDFQRHVTQASVERPAVAARAATLEAEFATWRETGSLSWDEPYRERTGHDPSQKCKEALS